MSAHAAISFNYQKCTNELSMYPSTVEKHTQRPYHPKSAAILSYQRHRQTHVLYSTLDNCGPAFFLPPLCLHHRPPTSPRGLGLTCPPPPRSHSPPSSTASASPTLPTSRPSFPLPSPVQTPHHFPTPHTLPSCTALCVHVPISSL